MVKTTEINPGLVLFVLIMLGTAFGLMYKGYVDSKRVYLSMEDYDVLSRKCIDSGGQLPNTSFSPKQIYELHCVKDGYVFKLSK